MTLTLFNDNLEPSAEALIHHHENSNANLSLYIAHKKRLSENSMIILKCLLEGQKLTGLSIIRGIKHSGMSEPKIMTEYRKRISECKEFIGKGNISERVTDGGFKEWWIEDDKRNYLFNVYKNI